MDARYHIGVDENGLGPRLGPMIVTAVMARVAPGAEARLGRRPRGGLAERLGDSKGLCGHGDVGLGEAWARALVRRETETAGPESAADLVTALSLDDRGVLTAPCPPEAAAQCWCEDADALASTGGGEGDMLAAVERDLAKLASHGIEVVAARSVIVCARRLNEAADAGRSRFDVDLHAMERLLLGLRERAGADITAVCGKVGGYDAYGSAFGPLGGRLHAIVEQGRARSAYRFPGLGDVAFVRDAEDRHLLVAMASLVGKYLRELFMRRIVRFYRAEDELLPDASGYHDPVTRDFVLRTAALRRRARVPDDCFERRRVKEPTGEA
jgi:ribonuclease HII